MSRTWLEARRQKADRRFRELGFPDGRSEAFKYTPLQVLKSVEETDFHGGRELSLPQLGRQQIAFVDGEMITNELPEHVDAGPLSTVAGSLEGQLGQLLGDEGHGLAALNLARFRDGLFLHVKEGDAGPVALHLAQGVTGGTCSYRHFIKLDAGTQADVLITTLGAVESTAHLNEVTEVFLGADAQLDLTWVHRGDDGLITTQELAVQQQQDSRLNINLFALRAGTLRHGIRVDQVGEDASVRLAGLSLAEANEHADYHLDLHHKAARGRSAQCFRGLVNKGGRVVMSGKVTVGASADGSDANQSLRGLLLEPGAEWDARPQLEIYTDDVSAAHGATVGNLDPEALFFLRSRGLDELVGRRMLAAAFAREIPDHVSDPRISSLLRAAVDERLSAMLSAPK